jgi:hypothetical protein
MTDDSAPFGAVMSAVLAGANDPPIDFEKWDGVTEVLTAIGARTPGDPPHDFVATMEVNELKGTGAHRELLRAWRVTSRRSSERASEADLDAAELRACEFSVVTFIPGGLFLDAAEVSRVEEGSTQNTKIYGEPDIEGPSSPGFRAISHTTGGWSMRGGDASDPSLSRVISVSLPVHARYPVVGNSSYGAFAGGPPHNIVRLLGGVVLANCTGNGESQWIQTVRESSDVIKTRAHEWIIPSVHWEWVVFVRVVTLTLTSLGTFILYNEGLRATVYMQ